MVIVWLVLGVVLLAVEFRHFAFFAFFGAIGSFAATGVAALAPDLVALQVVVAVVVAAIGIIAFRPLMSERFHRRQEGRLGRGVHGTLIGEEVTTLDVVGSLDEVGHVRLAGERWLAVSGSDDPIPAGTRVLVVAVEGTTLVVWPVDGSTPLPDADVAPGELQEGTPSSDRNEGDQP